MPDRNPEKRREYNRRYNAKLYAGRKAQGLCTQCGAVTEVPGRTMCADCLVHLADYARKLYAGRRAQQLCTRCGAAAVPERKMCADCLVRNVGVTRKRRKQSIARGICIWCEKQPSRAGRQSCHDCAVGRAVYQRKANARLH